MSQDPARHPRPAAATTRSAEDLFPAVARQPHAGDRALVEAHHEPERGRPLAEGDARRLLQIAMNMPVDERPRASADDELRVESRQGLAAVEDGSAAAVIEGDRAVLLQNLPARLGNSRSGSSRPRIKTK